MSNVLRQIGNEEGSKPFLPEVSAVTVSDLGLFPLPTFL